VEKIVKGTFEEIGQVLQKKAREVQKLGEKAKGSAK
jgi:hypothetical protein